MRFFFHLEVKCDDSTDKTLLPLFLHFHDLKWFAGNHIGIFEEICDIVLQNMETIEKSSRTVGTFGDTPPTRIHSVTGKVALAFCTAPRRQFANYSIIAMGASSVEQPLVCSIYPFEMTAWIFAIDPNDPYAPLPFECS